MPHNDDAISEYVYSEPHSDLSPDLVMNNKGREGASKNECKELDRRENFPEKGYGVGLGASVLGSALSVHSD